MFFTHYDNDYEFGAAKKKAAPKKKPVVKKKAAPVKKAVVKTSAPAATIRRVKIEGTARLNTTFKSFDDIEDWMTRAMTNQGWRVVNANFSSDRWLNVPGSYPFNVYFEADVSTQYTNQQHLDTFAEIMRGYELSFVVTSTKPITGLELTISGGDTPVKTRTGSTKLPKGETNDASPISDKLDIDSGDIFSNLGLGIGLSTPVVIALAIVGILAVRKI